MTEKRFVQNTNLVMQNNEVYVVCAGEHSADVVTTALNELLEENDQLKTQLQNTSYQRDEFHRGVRENANRVGKLEKENERLEKRLKIYKLDGLETLEKLQRCYNNSKKAMKMIDTLDEENTRLKEDLDYYKKRIKELEIENQGQSDAIDGLQEIMAHYDLEDFE